MKHKKIFGQYRAAKSSKKMVTITQIAESESMRPRAGSRINMLDVYSRLQKKVH